MNIVIDVQGKMFKSCVDENFFYPRSDPNLILILSLTLRVGLGLTPGKTISVENIKANAKHDYCRRRLGKNLQKLCT